MDNVPIEFIANAYLAHKKEISLGPFIVAQFLDAFFLGLVVMQVGTYFANRREQDGWIHKLSVVGVFLINLTTSILAIYWIYDLFVVKYGTFAQFLDIKTLFWFYITNGIGTALVQLFFVRRVFELTRTRLTRAYILVAYLVLLIGVSFACTIVIKVRGDSLGALASGNDKFLFTAGSVWSSCMVLCDISITLTILTVLLGKRTGWETTDRIITRLIRYTFQSQLPPTIFAIVYLIEYNVIAPKTPYVSVPFIMLQGKLYAFSLLHTLNARDSINTSSNGQLPSVWKEGRREKALSRIPLPFRQSRNDFAPAADQEEDVYPYFASVKVTTNTYIHRDSFDNIPVDTLDFRQSWVHNRIRSLGDDSSVIPPSENDFVIPLHHNANLSATQRSSGARPTEVIEIDLVDMNSMHKHDSDMESIDLDKDTETTVGTPCRNAVELIELERAPKDVYGPQKHVTK